jgi:hypothetical protein
VYCANPVDPIQRLNVFVPEAYCQGKTINGYSLKSAPIFMPNTVGGYMPGPADYPGRDFKGRVNMIFQALEHGYVVCSAGVRGRTTGRKGKDFFVGGVDKTSDTPLSDASGTAPAFAVDLKAAIRYLRHNADLVPGDTEKIITSGTSAGGALSALAGASGNQKDYEPYLKEIGAADERDDVFASNAYCPIHNLEHADSAYEWQFNKEHDWHGMKLERGPQGLVRKDISGILSDQEKQYSVMLKDAFPAYVNGLELKDEKGNSLMLDDEGEGSFKTWIENQILESAKEERENGRWKNVCPQDQVPGSDVNDQAWLKEDKMDWDGCQKAITRMKSVPAFDKLDGSSPENEEFGNKASDRMHFTDFSAKHALDGKGKADEKIIQMMNPLTYIGKEGTAKHWRIRHGAWDRDTSLAIPAILNLALQKAGIQPDFAYAWGMPHAGDYDSKELFDWIDNLSKKNGSK